MRPHIVFADLDGTLIVAPNGPGPGVDDLIRVTSGTGGMVVPVTARPVTNVARLFQSYPLVSHAVGSGGAVVARIGNGSILSVVGEKTLTLSDGMPFIETLAAWEAKGTGLVFVFKGSSEDFEVTMIGNAELLSPQSLAEIVGDRPLRQADNVDPCDKPVGISLFARSEAVELVSITLKKSLPHIWRASTYPERRLRGWSWLEIFAQDANKAVACREVLRLWTSEFGTQPTTIAAGDSADDVEMLLAANQSYCPVTASIQARAKASKILGEPGGDRFAAALARHIKLVAF